jgi:hypothetical protein
MHGNIHCHLVLRGVKIVTSLYLSCVFSSVVGSVLQYFFWLLVTLFPLSDGGVLVAVTTTCAVLRGCGYYLVPA